MLSKNKIQSLELKEFLDNKVQQYNCSNFIDSDPIQIPHLFSDPRNIEIAGFLSAMLAWGQRPVIIKKSRQLMEMMDNAPYQFITNASNKEVKRFSTFVYRTFQGVDCVYTINSLKNIYTKHEGLKEIFESHYQKTQCIKESIIHFRKIFFELKHLQRTEKHIPNIEKGAAGKRLNMFLKWMVRTDNCGVDFGLWTKIPSSALYIPLDLHTGNAGRALGLFNRKQDDWKSVEELTNKLRLFDPKDPVKYDYALFCLSIFEKLK